MAVKVSVVIPVYNTEEYLARCLASVCRQTLQELEIIVVNDGSPDNSQEIINDFIEKDNRVITILQDNQGLSAARNTGLAVARGQYVAFLDSDDWVEPDMYMRLFDKAVENDADIVVCNLNFVYQNGHYIRNKAFTQRIVGRAELNSDAWQFEYFHGQGCGASASNKLYSRCFLEANCITFDRDVGYAEDQLFNAICLTYLPRIVITNDFLYNYFQRSSSMVHSLRVWRIETLLVLVKRLRDHIRVMGVGDIFEGMRVRHVFSMVSTCMHEVWRSKGGVRGVAAMRKTLARVMGDEELARDIQSLARGKYLDGIRSGTWAIYVRVYCLMASCGMWTLLCALQHFRFDIGAILKKSLPTS